MGTRVGFFLFVGLILGAIIGNWLPYPASLETIAGGLISVVVGYLVDRRARAKRSETTGDH